MEMQVLTVSSKGQIAIPVEMRKRLSIESGTRLVAYASGDVIMLKIVKLPTIEDFDAALNEAQNLAASSGLNEDDVNTVIKSYRQRKRIGK
jgi:AbrB family looped-hinge helix DNA binding protein